VPDATELVFDEQGLIPAVIQDVENGDVLMVAWMNEDAVRMTLESGRTWFWSRSRQELWRKGDTSGHVQHVREVLYDCDADTLLVKVIQEGAACHTGERSCFHRVLEPV
jgi:phosphoribosyl-AMP cyclohydrolase